MDPRGHMLSVLNEDTMLKLCGCTKCFPFKDRVTEVDRLRDRERERETANLVDPLTAAMM